ncbi:unnamed protein product [Brassica oleracea var. botrytis]|uniref:Uncharacterized protein n=1 Tax=Brassica carinata TaxID=52824 RepID=A0A8X7TTS5_BRACI|nr:hypothetical protein Bca52824_083590 [Brassica carinata]
MHFSRRKASSRDLAGVSLPVPEALSRFSRLSLLLLFRSSPAFSICLRLWTMIAHTVSVLFAMAQAVVPPLNMALR